MSFLCRICLAGNMTLKSLKNNLLINVYERMSNTKFNSEDTRSRAICCYCYQKLLRCHTFSQMVIRSENIFSQLSHQGLEATHEYITEVNIGIKQQLSVTSMTYITIDGSTTDAGLQVTIKEEPISSVDIKVEATTEQDKLVDVESVPEYCTKHQLQFEESDEESDTEEFAKFDFEQTKPDDLIRTFICNDCNKLFFFKSKLLLHIRNSHYPLKGQLFSHINKYTRKAKIIKEQIIHNTKSACNVCDKLFNSVYEVRMHKRNSHTEEKPFACKMCDKKFGVKQVLTKHIRSHTGEKPFVCNVCNRQLSDKGCLVKHMKIHTRDNQFTYYYPPT